MDVADLFRACPHIGYQIFCLLDIQTLNNCSLTCKSWLEIANQTNLWLTKLKQIGFELFGFELSVIQEWQKVLRADNPPTKRTAIRTMRCQINFIIKLPRIPGIQIFLFECPLFAIAYRYRQPEILRTLIGVCENPSERHYLTILFEDLMRNEQRTLVLEMDAKQTYPVQNLHPDQPNALL